MYSIPQNKPLFTIYVDDILILIKVLDETHELWNNFQNHFVLISHINLTRTKIPPLEIFRNCFLYVSDTKLNMAVFRKKSWKWKWKWRCCFKTNRTLISCDAFPSHVVKIAGLDAGSSKEVVCRFGSFRRACFLYKVYSNVKVGRWNIHFSKKRSFY